MHRNKIMLWDCHAICHAAKYTLMGLSHREQETGVVYGFLSKLLSFQNEHRPSHIVFAWDSSKSKRKKVYPEYKIKRKTVEKTPEEIELNELAYPQFKLLRKEILPFLGFKNNFISPGLEADDIIASITQNTNTPCAIVSRDKDLYQLLSPTCSMLDPQTNKILTDASFTKQWGIPPTLWGDVKSLAGCPTDSVEGIERVGEPTAVKYLLGEMKESSVIYKRIQASGDIIKRNEKLVVLPFEGTKKYKVRKGTGINFVNFIYMCEKYGLNSFMKKKTYQQWRQAFGEKKEVRQKKKGRRIL